MGADVSADVLRRAAALMREQHGPDHKRHEMWAAMADWLDSVARAVEYDHSINDADRTHALAVARAYLGEQS